MRKYNTLVVEDSSMSQKVYKMLLDQRKDSNHEVTFATSAEMALNLYNANRYDIILVDMVLEGEKTGLDFVKAIQKDSNRMYTKVIIISGQTKEGMSKVFLDAGADDVYFKPIDEKGFYNRISVQEKDIDLLKNLMGDMNKMKDQLSFIEEKSSFISLGESTRDIMHEVNNSLSILGLCLQKLKFDEDFSNKHEQTFNLMNKALKNIETISSSVKKQGSQSDICEKINLKELIDTVISFSEFYTRKARAKVSNNVDSSIIVETNVGALEQVMVNLIKNSCEAIMNNERNWISIDAEDKENHIVLNIKDSGILSSEVEKKLFKEKFTTKESSAGTGVGLTIVKSLLSKYNISIEAKNINDNTCFSMKIPKV